MTMENDNKEIIITERRQNWHDEHHEFIQTWIEKERRRQERSDKVMAQVTGWFYISIFTALGTAAYNAVSYLKSLIQR